MISVKTNIAQFINLEIKRYNKAVDAATWSATNKVAKQARTQASKDIREEYAIKKSDLDKNISVITVGAGGGKVKSLVYVNKGKESLPLIKFGKPRQTKQGVWVQVKRTKMDLLPGYFIQTMKSGHKGIFVREQAGKVIGQKMGLIKAFGRKWQRSKTDEFGLGKQRVSKLPIKEAYSKAAAHIVTKTIYAKIKTFVKVKYPIIFQQEMKFRLGK